MQASLEPYQLLQFYADIGVDEAMGDNALDRFAVPEIQEAPLNFPAQEQAAPAEIEGLRDAQLLAAEAKTLEALRAALDGFKPLTLKRTATQMVFADGNPEASIMVIGEVPGADEDRMGKPFVGMSGQLFDKMFAAIGLSREGSLYISTVINWRPPQSRPPSEAEIALSLPFIRRHIELVKPKLLVFSGGVAAKALLETTTGITRLRGEWAEYMSQGLEQPIPVMCMFHPGYLLRTPAQKSLAWADLLAIKAKMQNLGIAPKAE